MANSRLIRPMDKVLYRPISLQNEKNRAQRDTAVRDRMTASSIRPEKRNGLIRSSRL